MTPDATKVFAPSEAGADKCRPSLGLLSPPLGTGHLPPHHVITSLSLSASPCTSLWQCWHCLPTAAASPRPFQFCSVHMMTFATLAGMCTTLLSRVATSSRGKGDETGTFLVASSSAHRISSAHINGRCLYSLFLSFTLSWAASVLSNSLLCASLNVRRPTWPRL